MSSEKHVSACGSTRSDKPFLLPPGTPLQLEIQDVSVKMNSLSVGYVAEKCLIIKYPSTGGFGPVSNKLFKGNKITVRYVNDGSVFGFQSELLGVVVDPVRLLFLGPPERIAHHSLRASKRVGCYLPAHLVVDHPQKEGFASEGFQDGIVEDISESGCNYRMLRDLPEIPLPSVEVGDGVVLLLRLPGTEHDIHLQGDVRRVDKSPREIGVGIQFRVLTEEKKKKIVDYISTVRKFQEE